MIWALALWPLLAGLALWAAGNRSRVWLTAAACLALAVTLVLALTIGSVGSSFAWAPSLRLQAALTPLSAPVAILVPAIGLAVVLFAGGHEDEGGLCRLLGLLVAFTGAMELVVIAGDLLTLLIGWELMGAISWALIGHRWRNGVSMPSATYAFVMTRAGDLGLFLAVLACFAGSGSLDYAALERLDGPHLALVAFGILIAAAAKAGQGPFAPWLFRAMDGPTSVSAYLHSSTMVAAGAFLIARLHPAFAEVPGWGGAAVALGLVTAIAGGVVALLQTHSKKVLAGSTSAQIGLMFAAAGAGWPGVAVLHLIAHAAFKAPLFFAAGIAHDRVGSFDLRGMQLGRALPATAVMAAIPALALAAIWPLGGAWTKEEVVTAFGDASPWFGLAGIVAGGLSAAYALRFVLVAFRPGEAKRDAQPSWVEVAALGMLSLATLMLGALWWPSIHEAAARAMRVPLPPAPPLFETTAALVVTALGLLAGFFLARHPREHAAADWLGLPGLIDVVVTRPALSAARLAARLDDATLDVIPRTAGTGGPRIAAMFALIDDRAIDGMTRAMPGSGALAIVVRAGAAAARISSRGGEWVVDLIPEGTGNLLGMTGADIRRTQTGLSHHYYVFLVAGAALGIAILILGA